MSVPGHSGQAVSSAGNSGRLSTVNFPMPSVFSYMVQIYGSDHGLRDV